MARQHIYYDRGEEVRTLAVNPIDPELPRDPGSVDLVSVTQIMSRGVACVRGELDSAAVAERMLQNHIGCLPVVNDRGAPIGMITKHDLVEQRLGGRRASGELPPQTARELMTPLPFSLDACGTIGDAAAMMTAENIHHVAIVEHGLLIGVVSALDIVRWLAGR